MSVRNGEGDRREELFFLIHLFKFDNATSKNIAIINFGKLKFTITSYYGLVLICHSVRTNDSIPHMV